MSCFDVRVHGFVSRSAAGWLALATILAPLLAPLVSVTCARTARATEGPAEPSAEDKESARVVFGLALGLREQGKLHEALEKFLLANSLYSTPITALELGKTHFALGQWVAASAAFESVAKIPVRSSESEKSASARAEAEKNATELRPRIPELTVNVVGLAKYEAVVISIDGVVVPKAGTTTVQLVDPGKHVVALRLAGSKSPTAEVTLVEGDRKQVTLVVPAAESVPILDVPRPRSNTPKTSPLVYVGFGIGVTGVLVGAVTGTVALTKASSVKGQCVGSACPPEVADDLDLSRKMGNVSTVSFVVGGLGAVIGVVGLLASDGGAKNESAKSPSIQPSIQPSIGLGTVGVVGAF